MEGVAESITCSLELFVACSGLGNGEDKDVYVATSVRAVDRTGVVSKEVAINSFIESRAEGGVPLLSPTFFEAKELEATTMGNWFGFWMQFPMTHNREM